MESWSIALATAAAQLGVKLPPVSKARAEDILMQSDLRCVRGRPEFLDVRMAALKRHEDVAAQIDNALETCMYMMPISRPLADAKTAPADGKTVLEALSLAMASLSGGKASTPTSLMDANETQALQMAIAAFNKLLPWLPEYRRLPQNRVALLMALWLLSPDQTAQLSTSVARNSNFDAHAIKLLAEAGHTGTSVAELLFSMQDAKLFMEFNDAAAKLPVKSAAAADDGSVNDLELSYAISHFLNDAQRHAVDEQIQRHSRETFFSPAYLMRGARISSLVHEVPVVYFDISKLLQAYYH